MDKSSSAESIYFFSKSLVLFFLYFFLFFGISSFIIYVILFITFIVYLYGEKGSIIERFGLLFKKYIDGILLYKFIGIIPVLFFIGYSISFLFLPLYIVSLFILIYFFISIRTELFINDKVSLKIGTADIKSDMDYTDLVVQSPFIFSLIKQESEVYEIISCKREKKEYVKDVIKRFYPNVLIEEDIEKEKKFLYKKLTFTSFSKNYFKYFISFLNEDIPFSISLYILNPFKNKDICFGFIFLSSNDKEFLKRLENIFLGTPHSLYIKEQNIPNILDILSRDDFNRDTILEVPDILPASKFFDNNGLYIGKSGGKDVFINDKDRETHSYVIGKSGTGKSTFLSNLIAKDIKNGKSVIVLDPHDLTQRIKEKVNLNLNIINPSDKAFSFNPLSVKNIEDISYIVDNVASVFHSLYKEFWGPQSDDILRRSIKALILANKNFTLLDLEEFLTDDHMRIKTLYDVNDQDIKSYFENIYQRWDSRSRNEKIAPLLNKLGRIKGDDTLNYFLSGKGNVLDIDDIVKREGSIIFNLSKSQIGDENSKFLGSLILSFIQIYILRKDIEFKKYIYIDEFQNFLTDSLVFLFSESRKFGVSVTLANQYITQIDQKYQDTILENTGIFYIFNEGDKSRKILSQSTDFEIKSIPKFFCFVKVLDNPVFSIRTDE